MFTGSPFGKTEKLKKKPKLGFEISYKNSLSTLDNLLKNFPWLDIPKEMLTKFNENMDDFYFENRVELD